jgi:hypothetical protein
MIRKSFLVFIYSAIALSGWSYYLLCDLLGLRFFMYEVYFIPVVIAYRKEIVKYLSNGVSFKYLLLILIVVVCFLLGILRNPNYIIAHITTYRTIFYYLFISNFISKVKSMNINIVKIASSGAILGQFFFMLSVGNNNLLITINAIALSLMVIIPVVQNKILETAVFSIFGLLIAFLSGFRIYILLIILCFFISLLYSLLFNKRFKTLFISLFAIIGTVSLVLNFERIILLVSSTFNMDAYTLYRVTNRLTSLLTGNINQSQDNIRIVNIMKPIIEFFDNVIPKGLIGKAVNNYGLYKDLPIFFLYGAFGSILSLVIIGVIYFKGYAMLFSSLKMEHPSILNSTFGIMVIVFTFLIQFNGTFLLSTYDSVLGAIVVGTWFNKNLRC